MKKSNKLSGLMPIVLAAIIALCAVLLVGCNKDAGVSGETYYLYDENEEKFDYSEYVYIDGEKCTIHVKGEDGMKDLNIDGNVTYEDNKVSGSGGIIVTKLSDFLAKDGLNDLYEELGVTKLDMDFTANIKCEFTGTKYSNAIVVTSQSMTIRGFTGLLSMFNGTQSSSQREVYCKKGQTPDFSVNVTIDCNGGTLGGKSTVVMRTDKTGRLELSDIKPTRDGYIFDGFTTIQDFDGYVFRDDFLKVDEDKTIYAHWRETVKITYDINSTEYKVDGDSVIRVGKGINTDRPKIVPIVANPTTRFKAWYVGTELCFKWSSTGEDFYEDTTVKAEWYTASEVAAYNSTLTDFWFMSNFIIHYMPKNFSIRDIGNNGGSSYSFKIYSVQDGQKGYYWGDSSGTLFDTDKSGQLFRISNVDPAYDGDVYLEINSYYTDKPLGSVIIPKSDLGIDGHPNVTHIFLDANDLTTYRTTW